MPAVVRERVDIPPGIAAGRDVADLTLSINHWLVRVTPSATDADAYLEKVAASHGVEVALLRASPAVLVGTVEQLADTLVERREQFGFSHLQLDAGFPPKDLDSLLPLVARLAGT